MRVIQIIDKDSKPQRLQLSEGDVFIVDESWLFHKELNEDEILKIPKEIEGTWQMIDKPARVYSVEEKMIKFKGARNTMLSQVDWLVTRAEGEKLGTSLGVAGGETLSEAELKDVLQYMKDLRDAPATVDLTTVDYNDVESLLPTMPLIVQQELIKMN